ncbi:translation initiation factor IF-3 [Hetaerina americana]|uniref:translation initiation factor IF-3 n=1 Tax=Hetaerina americana TaxID=62018 RepID=UPI003A7F105B
MMWRQIFRIATQRSPICMCADSLMQNWRCICYSSLSSVKIARLSTFNDGVSRTDLRKKESSDKKGSGKKVFEPKITLIGTDENISIVSLEDGHKIAKRRNLRLVKMLDYDTKTQRPVYRLMSLYEFNEEHKKEKASKTKSPTREKLVTFSSRISDHDIQSKVKMMDKWLSKNYEVRVVISGDSNDPKAVEEVYKTLESRMKETARFLQKRQVNADIRFNVKSLPESKSSAMQEKIELNKPVADS